MLQKNTSISPSVLHFENPVPTLSLPASHRPQLTQAKQKLNQDKLQSKTNNWCEFHIDLIKRRLLKSQLKKLMVKVTLIYMGLCQQ